MLDEANVFVVHLIRVPKVLAQRVTFLRLVADLLHPLLAVHLPQQHRPMLASRARAIALATMELPILTIQIHLAMQATPCWDPMLTRSTDQLLCVLMLALEYLSRQHCS